MYQLVSAVVKQLGGDERWIYLDISGIPLNALFLSYSKIIATLINPVLVNPVALDLSAIRADVGGESITIVDFLIANGNKSLPTTNTLPSIYFKYAKYADAFHAGYKIAPINKSASPDSEMPPSEKKWLHLTRPNTDYNLFYKSCLVNVNGFFHLTDSDSNGIYVADGMTSCRQSGENQIGILSFRELGSLELIPITSQMIYKQKADLSYLENMYVNLGKDVSDKTVMLVIGGYLHVLDSKTFSRINDTSFRIDFKNFPLLDRYYESKSYLDFSTLSLSKTDRNPDQVSINELYSDECLLAYLTLSQSFFVILDNSNIFVNKVPVRKTKLTDMYIAYQQPIFPLIVGVGKITTYWPKANDSQFTLACKDTLIHNRLFDTVDIFKQNSVSSARIPNKQVELSDGYFLQIGASDM